MLLTGHIVCRKEGMQIVLTKTLLKGPEDVRRAQEAAHNLQVAGPASQIVGNRKHIVEDKDPQPANDCRLETASAIVLSPFSIFT